MSCAATLLSVFAGGALAQVAPLAPPASAPFVTIRDSSRLATLASGAAVQTDWEAVWRPVCGSSVAGLTTDDLLAHARNHQADLAHGTRIVDGGVTGAGINIVFALGPSVPNAALPAFAAAETYLESLFSDPITVTVSCSFQVMQNGVLGSTGSQYTSTSWSNSRAGLLNGRDASDTIHNWLPTGATIPVRYNGAKGTVTNEDRVFWTRAAFNSTVGNVSGDAGSMTYNSNFGWDFDPSDGVSGYSFQDVIIHETGHALGFTSGADFRSADMEALDIFRFQRTDGNGQSDYNPDTLAEFQAAARLVSKGKPRDDHNSDVISAEFRMSDGSFYQASHFREQSPPIGLMDPALGSGQTFYPTFFTTADLTMFDAIGYDR